jgi:hypothetical protein
MAETCIVGEALSAHPAPLRHPVSSIAGPYVQCRAGASMSTAEPALTPLTFKSSASAMASFSLEPLGSHF